MRYLILFFAKMSLTFQKSLFFILLAICLTQGEIVQNIVTKVSNCFNCGMIEDVGQLDIKICGDVSCCFIQHMDNSGINFLAGQEDLFEGPASLLECYEYLVSPQYCLKIIKKVSTLILQHCDLLP